MDYKTLIETLDDMNADDVKFSPEVLNTLGKGIEDSRHLMLLNIDDAGSDPYAEQYYLLALSQLESAASYFKLAAMHQSKALAGKGDL